MANFDTIINVAGRYRKSRFDRDAHDIDLAKRVGVYLTSRILNNLNNLWRFN